MNVEVPVKTEAQQILDALAEQGAKLDKLTKATNEMGANLQWIIERAGSLFEMFASPQMMQMLPQMMGGAFGAMPGQEDHSGR